MLSQEGSGRRLFDILSILVSILGLKFHLFSSLFSGLEKEANIGLLPGIAPAEFSAWVRLGGNRRRFSPLAWVMTGQALAGKR